MVEPAPDKLSSSTAPGEELTNDATNLPLENLQRWLQDVLVHPISHGDQPPQQYLPPAWRDGNLESVIRSSQNLTAREHLAIYQRSYLARLRDCMAGQFSALAYALGSELFEMFADQYLQRYPSESHTLVDLGKRFPQYLADTRPDADDDEKESWPDFMIELARFEYATTTLFDQAANEDLCYANMDTPDAELALNPVSRLFAHQYPVVRYYREFVDGRQPELPFPQTSYGTIVRKRYRLGLFDLQPVQYRLLRSVEQGHSVPDAMQRVISDCGLKPQFFDDVWATWKQPWTAAGFFVQRAANRDR